MKTTVYYDGACPLCSMEIKHYQKQDTQNAVDFIDVSQDVDIEDLDVETARKRFHVRQNSTLHSGARGFVALWAALPGWRRIAPIARLPGIIHILELGYRAFLPFRPYLAKFAPKS